MTKVFISSVQKEFSEERKALVKYIREDVLLCKFFQPFIFEELPAINLSAPEAYLYEAAHSDIYLENCAQPCHRSRQNHQRCIVAVCKESAAAKGFVMQHIDAKVGTEHRTREPDSRSPCFSGRIKTVSDERRSWQTTGRFGIHNQKRYR